MTTISGGVGNFGAKTVFDKKTGKFVSVTAEQVQQSAARRAAQAAEKAAKDMGRVGNKTVFNEATGLWESVAGKASSKSKVFKNVTEEGAKSGGVLSKIGNVFKKGLKKIGKGLKKVGSGLKTIGSKIGKFLKGKGGKVLGVGLIIAGLAYLINKLINKDDKNVQQPDKPVQPDPVKPTKPTKPINKIEPGKINPGQSKYIVVKGDCVWNIAKKDLIANNTDPNYKPSNKEILKRTQELMKLNNLKFEKDNYHVMIKPGQELKLREEDKAQPNNKMVTVKEKRKITYYG